MSANRPELAPFEQVIRSAFAAEQDGTIDDLIADHDVPARSEAERAALPEAIRESHDFYLQQVERADWGSVRLLKLANEAGFAVRVRTDGDDGWLEAFDTSGHPLAAGRTYLDRVVWRTPEQVRAMVATHEIPAELQQG